MDFDEVLGLELRTREPMTKREEIPEEVSKLVQKREELRKQKKFAEADDVRKQIEKKRYEVEDTPKGSVVKKNARSL